MAASDRLERRENKPLLAPENIPFILPDSLSFLGEPSFVSLKESWRPDGRLTLFLSKCQRVGAEEAVDADSGKTDLRPTRVGLGLACSREEESAVSNLSMMSDGAVNEDGTDVAG